MVRYSIKDAVSGFDIKLCSSSDAAILSAVQYASRLGHTRLELELTPDGGTVSVKGKPLVVTGFYFPKPNGRPVGSGVKAAKPDPVDRSWRPRGPKSSGGWQKTTRSVELGNVLIGLKHPRDSVGYAAGLLAEDGTLVEAYSLVDQVFQAQSSTEVVGKRFKVEDLLAQIADGEMTLHSLASARQAAAVVVGIVNWDRTGKLGTASEKPVPGTCKLMVYKTKLYGEKRDD